MRIAKTLMKFHTLSVVNVTNKARETPLFYSSTQEMMDFLVGNGARPLDQSPFWSHFKAKFTKALRTCTLDLDLPCEGDLNDLLESIGLNVARSGSLGLDLQLDWLDDEHEFYWLSVRLCFS